MGWMAKALDEEPKVRTKTLGRGRRNVSIIQDWQRNNRLTPRELL